MELAKLTSKGQITIPVHIRRKMKLNQGDKVFFIEDKGRIYFENASQIALSKLQLECNSCRSTSGFENEDDIVGYVKSLRNKQEN